MLEQACSDAAVRPDAGGSIERPRLHRWLDAITDMPGSTRSVGLMRIGLALLGWAELGHELLLFQPRPLWLSLLFFVSTSAMCVGLCSRLATFAAAVSYGLVITRVPELMLHHTYLLAVATALLSLTPCGGSFSVDRWLCVRQARRTCGPIPEERGNLWALRLVGLQVSALFFWGGYNKLTLGTQSFQWAFLSGDRLEQILVHYYSLPVATEPWMKACLAVLGTSVVVFEIVAAVALWIPRVRAFVLVLCVFMTASFQVVLSIRTFGMLSWVLYLAFVPPERVHRVIDDLLAPAR